MDVRRSTEDYAAGAGSNMEERHVFELLSPREVQVIGHVMRGLSNKMIATEMGISLWTVKAYVHSIFEKLHVPNRAAAAALWASRPGDEEE